MNIVNVSPTALAISLASPLVKLSLKANKQNK
jgi:hypothetical protein